MATVKDSAVSGTKAAQITHKAFIDVRIVGFRPGKDMVTGQGTRAVELP